MAKRTWYDERHDLRQELRRLEDDYAALAELYYDSFEIPLDLAWEYAFGKPALKTRPGLNYSYSPRAMPNYGQATWTTADGEQMLISQMDESHLRNTISYLQRRLTADFGRVLYLSAIERHITALSEMLKEARRRHIEV